MANPFMARIEGGSIQTLEELHSCYRRFAKELHPDTSPHTQGDLAFQRLQSNFEEARHWLETRALEPAPTHTATVPHGPEDAPGPDLPPPGSKAARDSFFLALENLLARTWPFTKGKESQDASLARHIREALANWDLWQPAESGLFGRVEAYRTQRLALAWGVRTSDRSAWESLAEFLGKAGPALDRSNPANGRLARSLARNLGREALLKLGRREGAEDCCRLVEQLLEELEDPAHKETP